MELVNEWLPTGKFRNVDTTFRMYSTYKKETMAAIPLTGNVPHMAEMEYHGKFGHTLGRIQHIYPMNRIDICYATCCLETQNVAPTLNGFQGIKRFVQYMDNNPHKPIFYPYNYYDGSNTIRLSWFGNQVEYHTTHIFLECHQDADHAIIINRKWSVSGIFHNLIGVEVC